MSPVPPEEAETYEDGDELFPGIPKRASAARKASPAPAAPGTEPDASEAPPKHVEARDDEPERLARETEPAPPPPRSIEPARPARKMGTGAKALVGGFALAAAVSAAALLATSHESESPVARRGPVPPKEPSPTQTPLAAVLSPDTKAETERPAATPAPLTSVPSPAAVVPKSSEAAIGPRTNPGIRKGKSLKELAPRSSTHSALASILEAYDPVRKNDFKSDDRLFQDYKAKDAREKELLDQVRSLGGAGVDATKDMLRELDDDGYRIFLAKALAGMSGPDALKAVSEMLTANQGMAVQKTLAVFLPDTLEASRVITAAFSQETNARSRVMLLDEFARRSGAPQDDGSPSPIDVDSARAFFRKAVLEDADPVVRAEAVTLLGRRADPQDADLMATVAQKETQLQIRQAAIISLGSTGTQNALPTLQDLAQNDGVMEVRATAVLAIAKVGADPAARDAVLRLLDQIGQNDSRDEVRSRAVANANALRLRTKAEQDERARPPGTPGGG